MMHKYLPNLPKNHKNARDFQFSYLDSPSSSIDVMKEIACEYPTNLYSPCRWIKCSKQSVFSKNIRSSQSV